ncbi:phage tail protein, partial [Lonsdalea britannica]|uniref:phage tail protein n=1 Tax=Lonsdalea britannica TaxID=1082704 RepID=UPI0026EEB12B
VSVQLKIGADVVMSGRLDRVRRSVSRSGITLSLSGRDDAAILVDCAAPVMTSRQISLEEVVSKVVRPLGITNIQIHAESSILNDKISAEPGERAWDLLLRVCAARGLWPWFSPDGTLIIGGPDYTAAPVATLVLRRNGSGNNLLSLDEESSIERSFSTMTVLAQGHAHAAASSSTAIVDVTDANSSDSVAMSTGTAETGLHGLTATVTDPTVTVYRPQILRVSDADNQEQVNFRARKTMSDARLAGYSLMATVAGHRTSDDVLWTPGQRIHVVSEPHSIDAIFFLMGREFNGGRPGGTTTTLRLKEDGIWIPDAYPKKKKQRKRKGKREVAIVDVG